MYCFFDTETTGLPDYSKPPGWGGQPRIAQLGAILTDSDGHVQGSINLLIRPEGWEIPDAARRIHGITTEHAMKYGVPIFDAIGVFMMMADHPGRVIVAHNIAFDYFMVDREYQKIGGVFSLDADPVKREFLKFCTMEGSRNIIKIPPTHRMVAAGRTKYKTPSLVEACRYFNVASPLIEHDAMADAWACKDLFFAMKRVLPLDIASLEPNREPLIP